MTEKRPSENVGDDRGEADGSSAYKDSSDTPCEESTRKQSGVPGRNRVRLMQTADGSWQVVHPGCAQVRQEDLVEVEQMIDAGEVEIAQDELRWLLAECRDFISAHKLLGDLAASENDFRLARGHYGYAYQIVIKAIDASGQVKALPYRHEANQTFFQAGRGLASCLNKLGKPRVARDVINRLLQLDPSDPLRLGGLQKSQGGKRGKKRR